jgi:hypothetical protein
LQHGKRCHRATIIFSAMTNEIIQRIIPDATTATLKNFSKRHKLLP